MRETPGGARLPLVALGAALSTTLVVATLAGFVVGTGNNHEQPARASAAVAVPTLSLRVPEAAVTMTARPRPQATPVTGTAAGIGTARSLADPTPPSAPERDRELAALVAASRQAVSAYRLAARAPVPTPDPVPVAAPPPALVAPSPAAVSTSTASADFVLSTFNVLGNSHTLHGGRGRASGVTRIHGAAALLTRHDVDVAGFQELQSVQARALLRVTHGAYALYPGAGAGQDSDNSIGWRTSQFELVRTRLVSIPYFNGHHRSMPAVLLRHRASGVLVWFANFHNPAETSQFHHQQGWRTQATSIEAALANELRSGGVPLFVTGDMNERASYFCRFTGAASSMVAARGGTSGSGGCQAGRPRAVDWIFGTRGVSFSGYDEDRTHLVDITTDHPVVSTRVHVAASVFPQALAGR